MPARLLIVVLLAATSGEKVPEAGEWKCLQARSGGRLRVQLDAGGDTARLTSVPNDGGNDSEIDLRFEALAATLFAREGLGVHVTGHRITGPITVKREEALRQAEELFAALGPRPRKARTVETREAQADGTVRVTLSSASPICGSTTLYLARVQLWCGKEAVRSWSFDTFACDPSEEPAGRAHAWANAIFEKHQDSPLVRDAPGERLRLRR